MARHWAEECAKDYLISQGYTLLKENYSIRAAEIDLIMQKDEVIIFVEVKQRKTSNFGSAAEAISQAKITRLRKVALHYLIAEYGRDDLYLRFDAVLLEGIATNYKLRHLKAIF